MRAPAEPDILVEAEAWTEQGLADARVYGDWLVAICARVSGPQQDALQTRPVSLLLGDDARLHELNRHWRDKDKPTNVLSFPGLPMPQMPLGDVAISLQTCAREASEQGKELPHHVFHLFVHGVLHLLGYDHETETQADEMESLESSILTDRGLPDPWALDRSMWHGGSPDE